MNYDSYIFRDDILTPYRPDQMRIERFISCYCVSHVVHRIIVPGGSEVLESSWGFCLARPVMYVRVLTIENPIGHVKTVRGQR